MSGAAAGGLAARIPELEGFLRQASSADSVEVLRAETLSGGAIQENWLVEARFHGGAEAGEQRLVLRTDAPSGVAISLSRAEEFRLLQVASNAGVTVPEPLWLCEDPDVLGKPFCLMRCVPGTAVGRQVVRDDGPGGDKTLLAERLGQEMAKIHQIKEPPEKLDFLDRPGGNPARHTVARYREHLDRLGCARPAIEWGLRWCEIAAPDCDEICLVHQDLRTGNYMVDESGLTAILDWEFAAWGDPMSDLGWFCAKCWRFGQDEREAGGIAGREPFYRGYESVSGKKVDSEAVAHRMCGDRAPAGRAFSDRRRSFPRSGLDRPPCCGVGVRDPAADSTGAMVVRDDPRADKLLLQARKTLLEDILPNVAESHRYEALMVASAMGIAARELAARELDARELDARDQEMADPPSFAELAPSVEELAAAIRKGERDGEANLHRTLYEDASARLAISNPKLLVEDR